LKLLFDQNLPHRFTGQFADIFPGSKHVKDAGLAAAADRQVWEYARSTGFAIISKDADLHQMSFLYGAPPKTIWLRITVRIEPKLELPQPHPNRASLLAIAQNS
jgi:predicted nuclease of predicted toxin-antitoxin system